MDEQAYLDAENSVHFRERLRALQKATIAAREAESVARSAYALIDWLDGEEGKTPAEVLLAAGVPEKGVSALVMLIDGYRATHRLMTPAQLYEMVGMPEPEVKPAKGRKKKKAPK